MIKWIIILIIALVVLGYFGIDIRKLIDAPTTQANIHYVENTSKSVWDKYLKSAAGVAWKEIDKYIWQPGKKYVGEKFEEKGFTTMKLNSSTSTEK